MRTYVFQTYSILAYAYVYAGASFRTTIKRIDLDAVSFSAKQTNK